MTNTGSYAQKHGHSYHPISVEIIKRMANEGLSIDDAKEILHETERLLGTTKLTLDCFFQNFNGIEDSIKDTISPMGCE